MRISWAVLLLVSTGCALGSVRRVTVGPLQDYGEVRGARVEPSTPAPLEGALLGGVASGLAKGGQGLPGQGGFRLRVNILEERAGQSTGLGTAATVFGLTGATSSSGRLAFEARLFAPDEEKELGYVRWEGTGDPNALAPSAGSAAGEALAREMELRRHERVERRVADERLFLTPTAQTLPPGTFFLSNDELLLFRIGAGVHRRVQLDFWLGGFGVPFAGGLALPVVHVLAAAGGVGLGIVGVANLGVKVRILDEGKYWPGVALSYDMLNVFGAVFGAGALIIGGKGGAAIGAAAGVGTANLQFNVFSGAVAKHFGPVQVVAGTYVVDNHHWVPQNANILVGYAATTGNVGGGADSTPVPIVPVQVFPFLSAEWVLGPHSALISEVFPRIPAEETMVSTGVRWQLGAREPRGPFALDRLRFRIDLAGIWVWLPKTSSGRGGFPAPLPWLGLGIYLK